MTKLITKIIDLSDLEQTKYLKKSENDGYKINVYIDDGITQILIDPDTCALTIKSIDQNIRINKRVELGKTVFYAYPVDEGSAIIKSYYAISPSQPILYYGNDEFVVYDNFFRDNYAAFLSDYDKLVFQSNTFLRCIVETLMTFFDILFAYKNDIKTIRDAIFTKSKFLENIGNSFGFNKIDFSGLNTPYEIIANRLYRELLANLMDLIQLRGTKTAYEMFFNALGYDINLLEFWYDKDGNLIEINPEDESKSTFYAYTQNGSQLEEIQIPHMDPRGSLDINGPIWKNNKSNYIKPVITRKSQYSSGGYTLDERAIIKKYLEFLRPQYIKYFDEIIRILLGGTEDTLPNLLEGTDGLGGSPIILTLLKLIYEGQTWYRVGNTEVHQWIPANYSYSIDPITNMPIIPDPGRLDWDGNIERGVYRYSGGGMYAEHLGFLDDALLISILKQISEYLLYPIHYDSGLFYDDELSPIYYDSGTIMSESLYSINVLDFRSRQQELDKELNPDETKKYSNEQIIELLISEFNITEKQCNYLLYEYLI